MSIELMKNASSDLSEVDFEQKSVLFTDDDQSLLASFRRWFLMNDEEWTSLYATNAQEAIDILQNQQVDIVISDMRMPGEDGAELLAVIRQQEPSTIRYILSGFSDETASIRSISAAHQFFAKPINITKQIADINKLIERRNHLPVELWKALNSTDSLYSSPEIANQLFWGLKNADLDPKDLEEIIIKDPAITAKFVQIGSSSFFGPLKESLDIRLLLDRIGKDGLTQLASTAEFAHMTAEDSSMGYMAVEMLNEVSKNIEDLRLHSEKVANELVAKASSLEQANRFRILGMLHAIGSLGIITTGLKYSMDIHDCSNRSDGVNLPMRASAYLAELWGMDKSIVEVFDAVSTVSANSCQEALLKAFKFVYDTDE